jgi:hypothetical protein
MTIKLTKTDRGWFANGIETKFGHYANIATVRADLLSQNPGATVVFHD